MLQLGFENNLCGKILLHLDLFGIVLHTYLKGMFRKNLDPLGPPSK